MTHPKGNESVLKIQGLSKSFGDVLAVNDLSLNIFKGEIFGFLGPNGAGKTTTINMICGLLKSDSGEIWINGLPLSQNMDKCKHLIGLCPQNLVIWESLTCLEQMEFMARLYNLDRKSSRSRALELLEVLGLAEREKNWPVPCPEG